MFFSFKLCIYMPRSNNSSGVYRPKSKKLRTSRLFRSAHVPDPGQVRNGYGRARGVWAAPRRRRSNEAIWPRIIVPRIAYWGRDGKKLLTEAPPEKWLCIFIYIYYSSPFLSFSVKNTLAFESRSCYLSAIKYRCGRNKHTYAAGLLLCLLPCRCRCCMFLFIIVPLFFLSFLLPLQFSQVAVTVLLPRLGAKKTSHASMFASVSLIVHSIHCLCTFLHPPPFS